MPALGVSSTPPGLLSAVRLGSLLASLLVSLGSGTNYVFSAYGPQLSAKLRLSHTQMNIVGLSGNIGVYGTAPIWGRLVDTKGPKPLLALAFVSLLIGYNGIRYFYDIGLPSGADSLSTLAFCALVVCGFMTGIGGNGGLVSAMNATAKSFPDKARATTTGLVISGFGLSAFLFSSIAHIIFPGNTSEFLLVLAVGTSLPMVIGYFFVRPIPLPQSQYTEITSTAEDEIDDFSAASPAAFSHDNRSHTHLLHNDEEEIEAYADDVEVLDSSLGRRHSGEHSVPLSPPSRAQSHRGRSRSSLAISRDRVGSLKEYDAVPNVRGKALLSSKMFWLLFTITSLLSGTGIMYINNVGSISQALFAKGDPDFDEKKAAQWQATQVSTISVTNCLGRILIGLLADVTKNQLRLPRSFCMAVVAALFIVSQLTVFHVEHVNDLWKGSALLGLAYGSLFGLFPTIVIEWFGLAHFSENWGFVSLSPMIGGNIFSIAFGRNLDEHAPKEPAAQNATLAMALRAVPGDPFDKSHQCLQGKECYVGSLVMTTVACSVALSLAVYAGWKDYRRIRRRGSAGRSRVSQSDVVWESADD